MIELSEIVRQYPKELQRVEFYDQMVKEYFHHYMMQSLYTNEYSGKINFLGGTALRFFYGLKRFSEDLDFDCYNLSRDQFIVYDCDHMLFFKSDNQKIRSFSMNVSSKDF